MPCKTHFPAKFSKLLTVHRCAVGASFERRKHPELPAPLSDFFANRAKSLLDSELDKPRLSTVQALAILSTHEGGATRDTRGWLYSGMSCDCLVLVHSTDRYRLV